MMTHTSSRSEVKFHRRRNDSSNQTTITRKERAEQGVLLRDSWWPFDDEWPTGPQTFYFYRFYYRVYFWGCYQIAPHLGCFWLVEPAYIRPNNIGIIINMLGVTVWSTVTLFPNWPFPGHTYVHAPSKKRIWCSSAVVMDNILAAHQHRGPSRFLYA